MKLVDTSLFIGYERGEALAAERIAELLDAGELVVSAVTRYELTCSPSLRSPWREFYRDLFVLALTRIRGNLNRPAVRPSPSARAASSPRLPGLGSSCPRC